MQQDTHVYRLLPPRLPQKIAVSYCLSFLLFCLFFLIVQLDKKTTYKAVRSQFLVNSNVICLTKTTNFQERFFFFKCCAFFRFYLINFFIDKFEFISSVVCRTSLPLSNEPQNNSLHQILKEELDFTVTPLIPVFFNVTGFLCIFENFLLPNCR